MKLATPRLLRWKLSSTTHASVWPQHSAWCSRLTGTGRGLFTRDGPLTSQDAAGSPG